MCTHLKTWIKACQGDPVPFSRYAAGLLSSRIEIMM
jgi:hypothetical protein